MKYSDAKVGDTVLLTRCVAPYARGEQGVVKKIIKSRKVLRVHLLGGSLKDSTYDAHAANVDPVPLAEQ